MKPLKAHANKCDENEWELEPEYKVNDKNTQPIPEMLRQFLAFIFQRKH